MAGRRTQELEARHALMMTNDILERIVPLPTADGASGVRRYDWCRARDYLQHAAAIFAAIRNGEHEAKKGAE